MMRSSQESVQDTISPHGRNTTDTQFTPAMPQFSAPRAPIASRTTQNDTEYVFIDISIYDIFDMCSVIVTETQLNLADLLDHCKQIHPVQDLKIVVMKGVQLMMMMTTLQLQVQQIQVHVLPQVIIVCVVK